MPETEQTNGGSRSVITSAPANISRKDTSTSAAPPERRGQTFIADEVVSVIARIAAEQIEGVHRIGEPSFRSFFPGGSRHRGVAAEVGMKEAAVDIEVVVDFGHPIREVTDDLRAHVIETVETMTGCRMVEGDIHVVDVNVPKQERKPRRQLA